MKYTGIDIGPIVDTLMLAHKPKELWTASYMFSHLMKCIADEIEAIGLRVVSPARQDDADNLKVGLYPDKVFFKNDGNVDISKAVQNAVAKFCKTPKVGKDYVSIISATVESSDDATAIKALNTVFDNAELFSRPADNDARENVLNLISNTEKGQDKAFGIEVSIPSLETIAKQGNEKFSSVNYICIVQADGDNMSEAISNAKDVGALSKALLGQGMKAYKMIRDYGGVPIYIGGDDLLFIAPVLSQGEHNENIFTLLTDLNENFKESMLKCKCQEKPSMSFGLSITYHKYPLYEALKAARELLFDKAKNEPGKDAVAWCLRKHSGSGFSGIISGNKTEVNECFNKLMTENAGSLISAVAHKLRANIDLLDIIRNSKDMNVRLKAFYEEMLDEPKEGDGYITSTRELLYELLRAYPDKETKEILEIMYGMLRTAKFINGEEE